MTTGSASRRRLLALAVPAALAGCFEDPDAVADAEPGDDGDADGESDADDGSDADGDGESDADDGSDTEETATRGPVDPDDAGIVVEEASIERVDDSGHRPVLVFDVTVRNTGEHSYGYLELRVDAFHHPPGRSEENPVGFTYVDQRYDGFGSGTRELQNRRLEYDSAEANRSTDPDAFSLSVAVRRAETG